MSGEIEIKVTITGADELAHKLESEPPIVARHILQTSLRKAVRPLREEMISRVRRGWHIFSSSLGAKGLHARKGHGQGGREREFGVISENILIRAKVGPGDYQGSAAVFPSKRAFWAKFLEFGTRKMGALPFMRPAFEVRKQEVLDDFIEDVREQLRDSLGLK